MRGRTRTGDSAIRGRGVARRRFVRLAGFSIASVSAGCLGRDPGRGTFTRTMGSERVTTAAGDGVEILLARVAISEDAHGPRVHYRLRNTAAADATIALRTVLRVEEGGTYEATTYVDVPAGDEMVVGYRVTTWTELGEADAGKVRQHGADFDVYVNGKHRSDV